MEIESVMTSGSSEVYNKNIKYFYNLKEIDFGGYSENEIVDEAYYKIVLNIYQI